MPKSYKLKNYDDSYISYYYCGFQSCNGFIDQTKKHKCCKTETFDEKNPHKNCSTTQCKTRYEIKILNNPCCDKLQKSDKAIKEGIIVNKVLLGKRVDGAYWSLLYVLIFDENQCENVLLRTNSHISIYDRTNNVISISNGYDMKLTTICNKLLEKEDGGELIYINSRREVNVSTLIHYYYQWITTKKVSTLLNSLIFVDDK
jgi:hypothetical protein